MPKVIVDIAGYRQHRASFLSAKAQAISRIVLENGREMEFEPLTFEEFEVVEDELKRIPGVRAHAVGEGSPRVVIISPTRKDRPATGGPVSTLHAVWRNDTRREPYVSRVPAPRPRAARS